MKKPIAVLVASLTAFALVPARAETIAVGLVTPESVAWDPGTGLWYASNERGGPDGRGFISTIDPDGLVSTPWVTGLGVPFGVDVHDGRVYAGDQGLLDVIDIATKQVLHRVPLPQGFSANDVEVDAGTGDVYLSGSGSIVRVDMGAQPPVSSVFKSGVPSVNGLLVEGRTLYFVQITAEGAINRLDLDAPETATRVSGPIGALDGIVRAGDDFVVTDFIRGLVLRVTPAGAVTEIGRTAPTAADLGIDPARDIVAVPNTAAGIVTFHQA